jgi:hypothetical protein
MARRGSVAMSIVSVLLVFAATALATPRARPSDRACLIAWNSQANRANHLRLLALRPILGLQLLPAEVGTVTLKKGSAPTQTSAMACVLTLAKSRSIRQVIGVWKTGRVPRWSFGRPIPTHHSVFANVRLLADGRVTKIYLH